MTEPEERLTGTIEEKLEAARRELLELGLRNTLLNFRFTTRRGIEVVSPPPQDVYSLLVSDQKSAPFVSAASDDGSDSESTDRVGRSNSLLVKGSAAEMQKRLLATYYDARTSIEETGVNILFMALGMLEWYESESSEQARYAPLLLIPVTLTRESAQHPFKVAWSGEDLGENLSLAMKLKLDFSIDYPSLPDDEELDVVRYIDAVKRAVSPKREWTVHASRTVLGFFSFSKFLMFKDLDPSNWEEGSKPHEHDVVQALLGSGFEFEPSLYDDEQYLDDVLAPAESFHVVDADSTQTLALLEAMSGKHMVIQGPPGTGKSQTITNLIAEAIAADKTVLFVSEKMAALEVVKRRLDAIGIGDACLELHSNKTNKKAVLEELRRTLELGSPKTGDVVPDLEQLAAQRSRLNAYCDAVNTAIGPSGVTPIQAEGRLLAADSELKELGVDFATLKAPAMLQWTRADYAQRLGTVRELVARLNAIPDHNGNPFWASERRSLLPSDRDRLNSLLRGLESCDARLRDLKVDLAALLGRPLPETSVEGLRRDSALARHLGAAPDLTGLDVRSSGWQSEAVPGVIGAGMAYAHVHASYDSLLLPQAWDKNVLQLRAALHDHVHHFWRDLTSDYRRAKREVRSLFASLPPTDAPSLAAAVDAVVSEQGARTAVTQYEAVAEATFGSRWAGLSSDWEDLRSAWSWVSVSGQGASQASLPPDALVVANEVLDGLDRTASTRLADTVDAAVDDWLRAFNGLAAFLGISADAQAGALADAISSNGGYVSSLLERKDSLEQVVALNIALDECRATPGLEVVADVARTWNYAPGAITPSFIRGYAQVVLDEAYATRPELASFDGSAHESVADDFRRLDQTALAHNRARVLLSHWNRIPRHNGGGQVGILRHEFQKRRRHLPLRKLMTDAGNAIQAMKPVFMMSPLSVATYLPANTVEFDLVVFDEASQVKPVDAFGAIVRAKQSVVVGDSKQLPPSSFFDSALSGDDGEVAETTTADIESILGLFEGQGAATRMLRWHYRSRHESLIAVSNKEFYDSRLVIFPSPRDRDETCGLVFHHLSDTAYDRGGTATNPGEAKAVAEAAMEHARTHPDKTLGIAAFSRAQADAILNQMELLRRANSQTEAFFSNHPNEPFFVKNLENVQGDERDVIFISVGYGRTAEGYLAMQFGPLTADGGWRRLNVLITRARERCEVFSNITADDLDLSRTNAQGVQALKTYLRYAQTGIMDNPLATAAEGDSPFEDWVAARIRLDGFAVDNQVGSAGFFIDLAVRDPEKPGRYLLGIECDGATYHSSRSARDRDRLRQAVLEGLGWRIHRIWSTDWFRNSEQQYRRLREAMERAKVPLAAEATSEPRDIPVEPQLAPSREEAAPSTETLAVGVPYTVASVSCRRCEATDFVQQPSASLTELLVRVVAQEGPLHRDIAFRRMAGAAGLQRVGSRISERLAAVLRGASSSGAVDVRGPFIWRANPPAEVTVRDRALLDPQEKKIGHVPPEEVAEALRQVVRLGLGMSREDATAEASRALGFARRGGDVRSRMDAEVDRMLNAGELLVRNGYLIAAD